MTCTLPEVPWCHFILIWQSTIVHSDEENSFRTLSYNQQGDCQGKLGPRLDDEGV